MPLVLEENAKRLLEMFQEKWAIPFGRRYGFIEGSLNSLLSIKYSAGIWNNHTATNKLGIQHKLQDYKDTSL